MISFSFLYCWSIFYISDAFFTEKYFGPAASNKTFWTLSDHWSLIDKIESIPSKSLYLVHPPGVPQLLPQSLLLSRALVDNGLLFKQQVMFCKLNICLCFPKLIHVVSDLLGENKRSCGLKAYVQIYGTLLGGLLWLIWRPFQRRLFSGFFGSFTIEGGECLNGIVETKDSFCVVFE